MSSTVHQVLSTVELLEGILLDLPLRDLLLAQRVSKRWRLLITTSPSVQHALFFRAKPRPLLTLVDHGMLFHRFLRYADADVLRSENSTSKRWPRINDQDATRQIEGNPLLSPLFSVTEASGSDYSLSVRLPAPWREPTASWRCMLPAQPAIRTAAFVELTDVAQFWCAWCTEKTSPAFSTDTLRMGRIFDDLEEKYGRFPHGKKRIVVVGLNDQCVESAEAAK